MGPKTERAPLIAIWQERWGYFAGALYVALGSLFIPLAGVQSDEALFATPYFTSLAHRGLSAVRHLDAPMMVMSYLGALKTYLYIPILAWLPSNVWTIRLPMVLVGAVTVFLFYRWMAALLPPNAARLGAVLLATDPVFLLTGTFDWGPVALQHLLLVTACWSLHRFAGLAAKPGAAAGDSTLTDAGGWPGRHWPLLALGFFCLGLGMWNKAIFAWALAGLGVASLITLWVPIRRIFTWPRLGVAALAFFLGLSPLVIYNLRNAFQTFSENTRLDFQGPEAKWIQVKSALDGTSLFGYIVAEENALNPREPRSAAERTSVWLRGQLGERRSTGFTYVLAGLLLLGSPWWWRSRVAWFSLLFFAVSWPMMALTKDAGGSAHHVILLWPFPILFAVTVLSRLPGSRWLLPLAGFPLIFMNLAVLNQYRSQFALYGAADSFTDAMFPLSSALPRASGDVIYITDWGMFDSLNLLHSGRLPLRLASGPLMTGQPSEDERKSLHDMLADPNGLFLAHVREREAFADVGAHLDVEARAAGYARSGRQVIADSNGRPVFEVFRMTRLAGVP